MTDLFASTQKALSPFMTDSVSIVGKRKNGRVSGTFRACVFDLGMDSALAGEDMASDRRRISVMIPKIGECAMVCGRPQVGDTLTLEDGTRFKVDRVSMPMGDDWEVEARQA